MRSYALWLLKPWVVALAFKRYINKHGKKLGPYYYENIRDQDGNVKTIYVGTNPHQHPKHRIRKPLFFIILVLILILISGSLLFFMQNKSYIVKKVRLQQPDFNVDQILLKVLVKSTETLQKEIRVTNIGSEQASIKIEASGLNDILQVDSPSFEISPGQTKIVSLNFSTFDQEKKTEQMPGIYIGKLVVQSKKASKEIPAVVEVETKRVLFDLNLNPVAFERKIKQGTDTTIEVKLYNLESIASTNVDVDYFVKDISGNTIVTESETVVVNTQASFIKTISIPKNLKPGPYIFAAEAKFGSSIGTASYLFEVVGPEEETSFANLCKNNVLCLGLSLATVLLLFALMAYFYFFVGAYLYEKFTGMAALPQKARKKKEFEEAEENEETYKPGIFDKIKNKFGLWKKEIDEWKEEREKSKAEKAKLKKEEEIKKQKQEEQKKREELREQQKAEKQKLAEKSRKPSKKLQKFYSLLDEAQEALSQNDVSKINKLYIKESDLYIGMQNREKQEAYSKLMELYKQRNKLLEEKKNRNELAKKDEAIKQKEEFKKQQEGEGSQKEQEKERLKKQKELENQKKQEQQE